MSLLLFKNCVTSLVVSARFTEAAPLTCRRQLSSQPHSVSAVNLATLMESTRIELTVLYLQRQAKYENMEEHETQHVTASLYMEEPEYRNGIAWENMNIEMSCAASREAANSYKYMSTILLTRREAANPFVLTRREAANSSEAGSRQLIRVDKEIFSSELETLHIHNASSSMNC